MNCRRESSLYSLQPQSSLWLSLLMVGFSSIPLEAAGTERQCECFANPGYGDGLCGEVRRDHLLQRGRHLARKRPVVDRLGNRTRCGCTHEGQDVNDQVARLQVA